jgi:GNAT superfamily N-acetyltransferase
MEELHEYHMPFWPRDFLPDWRETWLRQILPNHDRLILLAHGGSEPAGFMVASIRRNPGLFEETYTQLEDAYVRAPQRRGGLGGAMLERVEAWSRDRGVEEVRLGVVAANTLGLSFWRKSGFAPLTYTMSKSLAGVPS